MSEVFNSVLLSKLIGEQDKTQAQLEKAIGLSVGFISKLVNRRTVSTGPAILEKIAKYFEVETEELLIEESLLPKVTKKQKPGRKPSVKKPQGTIDKSRTTAKITEAEDPQFLDELNGVKKLIRTQDGEVTGPLMFRMIDQMADGSYLVKGVDGAFYKAVKL